MSALAEPIQPPALDTGAAPQPSITPAPSAPGYFSIDTSEVDDATIAELRKLGVPESELGIEPEPNSRIGEAAVAPDGGAAAAPAATPEPKAETDAEKIARLERELAEAKKDEKGSGGEEGKRSEAPSAELPPVAQPLPGQPLATIATEPHLAAIADSAKALKTWAFAHRDGGELPLELAQKMEDAEALIAGRARVEVKEAPIYTAEHAARLHELAERMLEEDLPVRRQFLQLETGALAKVRETAPAMLDAKSEEGQAFRAFIQQYPQVRGIPAWPLLVRDWTTGYLANKAAASAAKPEPKPAPAAKAPEVATPGGGSAPLAPAAPIGGNATGGVPVSQKALDEAEARLATGSATEADMLLLSAHAV